MITTSRKKIKYTVISNMTWEVGRKKGREGGGGRSKNEDGSMVKAILTIQEERYDTYC